MLDLLQSPLSSWSFRCTIGTRNAVEGVPNRMQLYREACRRLPDLAHLCFSSWLCVQGRAVNSPEPSPEQ